MSLPPGGKPQAIMPFGSMLPTPEDALLRSRLRPRFPLLPVAVVGGAAVMGGLMLGEAPTDAARLFQKALALFVPLGVLAVAIGWGAFLSRQLKEEERAVAAVEEAVRMRQFESAVWGLSGVLAKPMLSPLARVRALFAYVGALVRFGRFDEAVTAVDELLEEGVPSAMVAPLRGAKAFALLREDRLADADRAVTDLKKLGRDGPAGAVLALAEHYREVRTGHVAEVLEHHETRRKLIAQHFTSRVADADALAAWAAYQLGNISLAGKFWQRATTVGNVTELLERFPELSKLTSAIAPAPLPPELVAAPSQGRWR